MELWDIYDCNREKTGETMKRGSRSQKNKRHLVVNICIFNSENKMLIQKRNDDKEVWPSLWQVTASGSAIAGETSQQAAQRELLEEVGVDYDFKNIVPKVSMASPTSFRDFYIIHKDVDMNELKLQEEEVSQVKWADEKEILDMLHSKTFVPNYESFISLLFEIGIQTGSSK